MLSLILAAGAAFGSFLVNFISAEGANLAEALTTSALLTLIYWPFSALFVLTFRRLRRPRHLQNALPSLTGEEAFAWEAALQEARQDFYAAGHSFATGAPAGVNESEGALAA